MSESLFDTTCNARDTLYASIGEVEPDVIAHIINPAFMGGPAWPTLRQAFSIIHRGESTIVISNGLADPFDDVEEQNSGFGIEVYAETKEPIEGNISDSSLFKLVYATAQQAAHSGQMAEFVRQYGVITMELYADDCGLHEFQNENGMVGVMIGIDHPDLPKRVDFPGGEVILASVQVLTPGELEYVVEARAEGRNALHRKFKDSELYHFLTKNRASLVAAEP
ncbi:hypothetical protein CAI21_03070 [Alkalilimnicola ehrlichii]|uniref:Suppressor of fused-like domain-containing protein n=1 Tax=Alkalilimnicola ehrlichii TaxID=351052 RepID=A0A3E0X0I0_9GAMM|nr:hypothetical protein [Alkalilimnicola ehrlichii]RFA30971.1 hypothetical protein CAI21_03070 [Alkalilimnicola ehrlichii]RFA38922.1 hypothetical protein CAL65_03215 [Alkalilimnicola ehrlichii]